MRSFRTRSLVVALLAVLLVAGLAQSASSRVDVPARPPHAERPDTSGSDEDAARPGTQVTPRAGAKRDIAVDVRASDDNGHNDVRAVNVTVLRADNATVHASAVDGAKLSGSGKRSTWRATVTMSYDDPPGEYILRAAVLDRDAAVTFSWTNFTYDALAALTLDDESVSLAPSGALGLYPGERGAPIGVNVTNAGNVAVNLTLSATPLANATREASVPASSLQASRSSAMSSAIALSGSAQTVPGGAIAPKETAPLYLSVNLPEALRSGDYAGELTVGAIAAS